MAELQLFNNNQLVRRYTLHQGGISIGRAPDNQIHLDSPAVDERHARVLTVGRSSVIQNLSADFGTYINDKEINRQTLRHDDVIQIGGFQLRFLAEDVATSPAGRKQSVGTQAPAAHHTPPGLDDLQREQIPTLGTPHPEPAEDGAESVAGTPGVVDADAAHIDAADSSLPAEEFSRKPPDTEIRAEAIKDALDDFESTLASEVDLDQIVDSRILIETSDELSDPAPRTPGAYSASDPADDPQPVPDYGELTDEMAAVLTGNASGGTGTGAKEPDGESDSEKQTVNITMDAQLDTSSQPVETPTDHAEEDDPVAAAIRARIRAKINANAQSQQETATRERSAGSVEESSTVAEAATQKSDAAADRPALVLTEQDEENTVLEFLPEPRHLTTAEQQIAAAQTPAHETTDEIQVPQTLKRDSAVELPTPPEWSLEGDDSTSTAAALTVQGDTGQGAQYGAVDIMHGPNAGLRIWLGKRRTIFGNHQDRALIIERHPGGFRVAATHRGNTVTLNGTLLLSMPENLQDGDHIEFSNMGLKFVLTEVRPAHPSELAQDPEEAAQTPTTASQAAPDRE